MKMNKSVEVEDVRDMKGSENIPLGHCVLSLRSGGTRISQVLSPIETEALIFALTPFAQHKHRWVTDEDGVVHPCECGAAYAPKVSR